MVVLISHAAAMERGGDQCLRQLNRLEHNTGPEEYFIGAVTLFRADLLPEGLSPFGFPNLEEALAPQIT